jgi:hypothetical protein
MTGWCALLEYQAAGFPPECEGFCLNSAYGLPNQGFSAGIAPRDLCFCVFGSSELPNTFKEKQDSQMQTQKKSSQYAHEN